MWKLWAPKLKEILKISRHSITIFANVKVICWLHNNFTQSKNYLYINLTREISRGSKHSKRVFYKIKAMQ